MSDVVDINTKKTRIARLLSEATPIPPADPPKSRLPLNTILIVSLVCNMLLLQVAITFFSFMAINISMICLMLAIKNHVPVFISQSPKGYILNNN